MMRGAYAIQGFGEYQESGVTAMTATSEVGGENGSLFKAKTLV
jgi:hypothetical protein